MKIENSKYQQGDKVYVTEGFDGCMLDICTIVEVIYLTDLKTPVYVCDGVYRTYVLPEIDVYEDMESAAKSMAHHFYYYVKDDQMDDLGVDRAHDFMKAFTEEVQQIVSNIESRKWSI